MARKRPEKIDSEELYYELRALLTEKGYFISEEADQMLSCLADDIAEGEPK